MHCCGASDFFLRFSNYIIRPQAENCPILACALTVFLGIVTLGTLHAICGIYLSVIKREPGQLSHEEQKVQNIVRTHPHSPLAQDIENKDNRVISENGLPDDQEQAEEKTERPPSESPSVENENYEALQVQLEIEAKRQKRIKELKLTVNGHQKAAEGQRLIQEVLLKSQGALKEKRQTKGEELKAVKNKRIVNNEQLRMQTALSSEAEILKAEKEEKLKDPKFSTASLATADTEVASLLKEHELLTEKFSAKANDKNVYIKKSQKLEEDFASERQKIASKLSSLLGTKSDLTNQKLHQQKLDVLKKLIEKIDDEKSLFSVELNIQEKELQAKINEHNEIKTEINNLEVAIQSYLQVISGAQEKIKAYKQDEEALSQNEQGLNTLLTDVDQELDTLGNNLKLSEDEQKRLSSLAESSKNELKDLGMLEDETIISDEGTSSPASPDEDKEIKIEVKSARSAQTLEVKTPAKRKSSVKEGAKPVYFETTEKMELIARKSVPLIIELKTPRRSPRKSPRIEVLDKQRGGKISMAELQKKQNLLDRNNPFLSEWGLYQALNKEEFFNGKIVPALSLLGRFGVSKNAHIGWIERLHAVKKAIQEGNIDEQHHGKIVSLFVYLALSILEEYGGTLLLQQGLDFFRKAYTHELPGEKEKDLSQRKPAVTDFRPLFKQLAELKMPKGDIKIPFTELPSRQKTTEMIMVLMKTGQWADSDLKLLKSLCPQEIFDKSWLPHFQLVFFLVMIVCKELVEQIASEKELRSTIQDIGIRDNIPSIAISGLAALEWKIVALGSSLVPTDTIVDWIPFPTKKERDIKGAIKDCKKEILDCDAHLNAKQDIEKSKKRKIELLKTLSSLEGQLKLEGKKPKAPFEVEKAEFQKSMLKELIGGFRTRHATSFLSYLKVVLRFLYTAQAIEDFACKPNDVKLKQTLQDRINDVFSVGMCLIPAFAKESITLQKELPMDSYSALLDAANEVIVKLEIPENLMDTEWVNWLQDKLFNPFAKNLDEIDKRRLSVVKK